MDVDLKTGHNVPQFTVTEISREIKDLVEERFSYVKVRGEISGMKQAPSGHVYLSLKDENSLISAICWKGSFARLPIKPEDGLEVIATGKITTYAGQSKYQLIIESMEHAGIGALMALLNKRKEQFEKEGLFLPVHKKKLPKFPKKIGVVTSPTGAVIQDILHRISERFPTEILLWPVLVQGDKAAEQISNAVRSFSALPADHPQRPDLIIVARGGGSLEDLWPFNEENVVRAVFECTIPLISAVGHETDTSLIDFVSDVRAPTPTAAAEIATQVRMEILLTLQELKRKTDSLMMKFHQFQMQKLVNLRNSLKRRSEVVDFSSQKMDELVLKIEHALKSYFKTCQNAHEKKAILLRSPKLLLNQCENDLSFRFGQIKQLILQNFKISANDAKKNFAALSIKKLEQKLLQNEHSCLSLIERFYGIKLLEKTANLVKNSASLLKSYDYANVIKRGFAIVRNSQGKPVTSVGQIIKGEQFELELKDGKKNLISTD